MRLQKIRQHLALGWLALLAAGCGGIRHVGYDTTTVDKAPDPGINAQVQVELFEDKRKTGSPALVFTAEDNPVSLGGKQVCFNLESAYAGTIPSDVRAVIERHFRQRAVLGGWNAEAQEYVLQGSILSLYARLDAPTMTGVDLLGGMPLSDELIEHDGELALVLTDLRLTRARDRATRPLPDVRITHQGKLTVSSDCEAVFVHVDRALKRAVEALAISVERELRAWPTTAP